LKDGSIRFDLQQTLKRKWIALKGLGRVERVWMTFHAVT